MRTGFCSSRCRRCVVPGLVALVLAGWMLTAGPHGAEPESRPDPQVLLEKVDKIYSDGKWNGRLGMVLWKGRFYIFFRSAVAHDQNGAIRMIRSTSNIPRHWSTSPYSPENYQATIKAGRPVDPIGPGPEAVLVIDSPVDESEMHVLGTPERLFGYVVLLVAGSDEVIGTQVIHTDNGTDWSKPKQVYEPGWSFWKPRSYKGTHFVVADVMTGKRRIELLSSTDGVAWKKVSTIAEGPFTETDLVFLKDGTLLAVARQGRVFRSKPPYTEWTSRRCPTLDGPAVALVGDTVLASGRVAAGNFPDAQQGERRNGLFSIDPQTLKFQWKMNMVTQWGGDVSYPHILSLDRHRALIAWYDGQRYQKGVPKQADIFLAILRLVPGT